MISLLKTLDVVDDQGKVVHSKLMATLVTLASLLLVGLKRIETEAEALVMISLIGVCYGHDWGKSFLKSKFPTNGDTSDTH